jgi:hypothetical protein
MVGDEIEIHRGTISRRASIATAAGHRRTLASHLRLRCDLGTGAVSTHDVGPRGDLMLSI